MAKLILIKHASPQVDPSLPPDQWELSEKGRASCDALAKRIAVYKPAKIISSLEAKAIETAALVAKQLGIPTETFDGLHEHDRSNVPHMRTAEFISMMELFFRRPDELVLGNETADQALNRFEDALDAVCAANPDFDLAVVSHGTVISLLLAEFDGRSPFGLWRQMGLPSFAVLSRPDYDILELVPQLA